MPVDLHLVSWNRPAMTKLVIKTIHRNTHASSFRLHVWDNGSDEGTQEMLKLMENSGLIDTLYLAGANMGLEKARHLMMESWAKGEYFVCVDNDCLPPPAEDGQDWLEKLVALMEKYPDFAAISCRTQVMIGTGNIFEEADQAGDDIVEFPHPGGSLRIMRTAAVKQVGGWRSGHGAEGRGAEERYICGQLREAGYRTAFAAKVQCLHLFGLRGATISGAIRQTDRWGYHKDLKPEDTGHSDISHPALTNGDDLTEVEKYAGKELTDDYSGN